MLFQENVVNHPHFDINEARLKLEMFSYICMATGSGAYNSYSITAAGHPEKKHPLAI